MNHRREVESISPCTLGYSSETSLEQAKIYDHLTPRLQHLLSEANKFKTAHQFKTTATVGHKLASCIPSSSPDHDFSTFLDPPIQSSFYFDPFVPAEVEDKIKVLPNNKAYGLYSCPVSILKLSSHIISQPLAQIFNVSVSSGSFPAKLKPPK